MVSVASVLAHPIVAGVAVVALVGTWGATSTLVVLTYRNRRLLAGEPAVDADGGLLGEVASLESRVREHRRALIREGSIPVTDGHGEQDGDRPSGSGRVDRGDGPVPDGGRPSEDAQRIGEDSPGGSESWTLVDYLPTGPESETARDGFLSSRPELHAVAIGGGAGALVLKTGEPGLAVAFGTVVFGTRAVTGHLGEARREAAYTLGGYVAVRHAPALLDLAGVAA